LTGIPFPTTRSWSVTIRLRWKPEMARDLADPSPAYLISAWRVRANPSSGTVAKKKETEVTLARTTANIARLRG
jgi:hypothetical protein